MTHAPQRTRAQRRYRKQGYTWEMASLKQERFPKPTPIYLVSPSESWRQLRNFGKNVLDMPIRPVAKHYIHKGGKP